MALAKQHYKAPVDGLVVAVTMNERLYSIHAIEIYCEDDRQHGLEVVSDSAQLTHTRVQHSTPRGFRIDGSLACEPAAQGGAAIRANLRFGYGSEQNYTHIRDEIILQFARHGAEPAGDADRGAHPHHGAHAPHGTLGAPAPAQDVTLEADAPAAPMPIPAQADCQQEDLFPYVYLRSWPQLPAAAEAGLAAIPPACAAIAPLYAALTATASPSRAALIAEAQHFCAGAGAYAGLFVPDCAQLLGVVKQLPKVAEAARQHAAAPARLVEATLLLFNVAPQDMAATLNAADYLGTLARVWQSYFAQLMLGAGDAATLGNYSRLLLTDHLLRTLFTPVASLSVAELARVRRASILLPAGLFPLPPALAGAASAIRACAIGDLQMVRRALLRYEAGELAHVENIMPGERRETRRSRAQGQQLAESDDSASDSALAQRADDSRNSLVKQAQEAIAEHTKVNKYSDFDTSYGPPAQARLNGSWTEWTKQGSNPGSEERTEFARDIVAQSVSRVARNVRQVRARGSYSHCEESVTSTIDNSAGATRLLCAFRWLNKVYRASVVSHGHRLMVEFMLAEPAAGLRRWRSGRDAVDNMPASLPSMAVASFADVGPANYAALAAACGVTSLTPPPTATSYLSATLCNGERKSLAVPAGYRVGQVFLTYLAEQPDADSPVILVGREKFKPGDLDTQVRTFGEDDTIALCVLGHAKAAPAPAPAPPPAGTPSDDPAVPPVALPAEVPGAPMVVLANIVIACQPGAALLDAWRIKTYEALLHGYQCRLEQARGAARLAPPHPRQQMRKQLRQGCTRMLLAHAAGRAGKQAAAGGLSDPWLMQFFGELFEWDKMSTRLYAGLDDSALLELDGEDEPAYAAFIEADLARVLLPVAPAHETALLYFLSSGQRWPGDPDLAPVDGGDAALVLELKRMRAAARQEAVGAGWDIVVPTAMQVQDAGFCATLPASGSAA